MKRRCIALAVLLAVGSPAAAESTFLTDTLTPHDLGRLAGFAKARTEALAQAQEGGEESDLIVLEGILAGEEQPIRGVDIRGDYRCRVAKLGGFLPIVVYDWFQCEIGEDDIGYVLQKTSGSQRLSGHFVDDSETSLIFYGAGHYDDEEPRPYGADAERNVVGRLVKVDDDRYRLELPLPQFESTFDILELEAR